MLIKSDYIAKAPQISKMWNLSLAVVEHLKGKRWQITCLGLQEATFHSGCLGLFWVRDAFSTARNLPTPCAGSGPRPVKTSPQRRRTSLLLIPLETSAGAAFGAQTCDSWEFENKEAERCVGFGRLQSTKPIEGSDTKCFARPGLSFFSLPLFYLCMLLYVFPHEKATLIYLKGVPGLSVMQKSKGRTWTIMSWRKSWTVLCHILFSISMSICMWQSILLSFVPKEQFARCVDLCWSSAKHMCNKQGVATMFRCKKGRSTFGTVSEYMSCSLTGQKQ